MKKRREKVGEKARRMAPKINEGLVMLVLVVCVCVFDYLLLVPIFYLVSGGGPSSPSYGTIGIGMNRYR